MGNKKARPDFESDTSKYGWPYVKGEEVPVFDEACWDFMVAAFNLLNSSAELEKLSDSSRLTASAFHIDLGAHRFRFGLQVDVVGPSQGNDKKLN